ncbi:MAG: methyl-accepting chemotaxis protein, partial [Treponema sp.]|nr:methyl-accepting chemotaxis protein [Treponema sp.]
MKIGNKLIIMILALTLAGIGVLLGVILNISQNQISSLSIAQVESLGNNEASQIETWLEAEFSIARSVAQLMEAYEQVEVGERRSFYNLILKAMAESNTELAAVWTCWLPNALDGQDARYINTPGSDGTGRFSSYWVESKGIATVSAIAGYETADYFLIPMQTGHEAIIEPYFYEINGVNTLVTSMSVPVKKNGKVIAVVGVDIALSRVQTRVEAIRPYAGSVAAAFSNGGHVAAHFDISRLGKPMSETETDMAGPLLGDFVKSVKAGSKLSFVRSIGGKMFQIICLPFDIGKTLTPWALAIAVPTGVINEPVFSMLRISLVISAVMLLAVAVVSFLIARSISRPLGYMTEVFTALGDGDLTRQLDLKRKDEIGDMAKVFNKTVENIKSLVLAIKNQTGSLFSIGNELSTNMTQTAAAVNEITANIQSIKTRVIN